MIDFFFIKDIILTLGTQLLVCTICWMPQYLAIQFEIVFILNYVHKHILYNIII